ncbi:hypothetical protein QBC40DRAFT_251193 [Triangularia verruculosa]|uniref:Uncharacterized protein n=1 Tax=Triangularia verruculosa TaxID=2587418 RepID=A0AAN6XMR0_9PEZI|nr:hypothetical protein QBC40DRAFT_251193 [Triangularia verruculosa]
MPPQPLAPPAGAYSVACRRRMTRQRTTRQLGFSSVQAFSEWEEALVIDHLSAFICDYLALGLTVVPRKDNAFIQFVDLDNAVIARIQQLEDCDFMAAYNPDKTDWTARDHYKQFIVSIVAEDKWYGDNGDERAELYKRGWDMAKMTRKMFRLLEFLIQEWREGPGAENEFDNRAVGIKMRRR